MSRAPDFETLAQPGIRGLRAYDPGHDLVALRREARGVLTELGSNENSHGPSPKALAAARAALDDAFRYPDPLGGDLKRALAAAHGVATSQVLLGNGSHELLMQFAQVFAGPGDEVVASRYGFAVYALAAQAAGATLVLAESLPRDAAMPLGHDLAAIAGAITGRTRLVYLANPNNPTGTWFDAAEFDAFMAGVPGNVIVVVDEAYAEYVTEPDWETAFPLARDASNVVVTRTFSKIHGLGGLRIGFGYAPVAVAEAVDRIRLPFNVSVPGLEAATAALYDTAHQEASRELITTWKPRLTQALRGFGFEVLPSAGNFVLVVFKGAEEATAANDYLNLKGIIVRPVGGYGLPQALRITIGTEDQNRAVIDALSEFAAS